MNDLWRDLAPVPAQAWTEIDEEATRTLKVSLAGRKIADFTGPLGWEASSVGLGRAEELKQGPGQGVRASLRQVQPLVELRVPFTLSRRELDAVARGAKDADLAPVTTAAQAIATAEDNAIFHGYAAAGIEGICEAAGGSALSISANYENYPASVAEALSKLRAAGVDGPYAIALGPRCFVGLTETTKEGFPIMQHVQRLLDGPVIWAPAVDGAAVVSLRGGDFELIVGRDFSIGYLDHSATEIELYIEESFTSRVLAPEAAVPLVYGQKKKGTRGK